jgi:DHA2 family multidrug resistance protein-like MFS transporter
VGDAVLHAAREAFTHGMHAAAIVAAFIMAAAAVLSTVALRNAPAPSGPAERSTTDDTPQPVSPILR